MTENTVICIGCPLGCHVTLKVAKSGEIEDVIGNQCKEGRDYAVSEFRAPVRVFTSTVITEGVRCLLPVRTDKPVHKSELREIMRVVAKLRVKPPVSAGEVIVHNILGTGANLIASKAI